MTDNSTAGEPITTGGGTELKPCPFCGFKEINHLPGQFIACTNINCGGQVEMGAPWGGPEEDGIAFLISAWNRRASEALGAEPHPIPAEVHAPDKPSGGELREAVARIISPGTFEPIDVPITANARKIVRRQLLKTADALLALLPNQQRVDR